jgi:hypothetical protein
MRGVTAISEDLEGEDEEDGGGCLYEEKFAMRAKASARKRTSARDSLLVSDERAMSVSDQFWDVFFDN